MSSSQPRRNCIDNLRDDSGAWHKGLNPLRAHTISYFDDMFHEKLVNAFPVIYPLSVRVTYGHIVSIFAPFNVEEVHTVVFAMDSDKSFDSDGLNPRFFKYF